MTRKIITTLLLIFILTACESNVETVPTSIPIPTLQSTLTSTSEPTAIHTPIPTEALFQYTSCLNPLLIEEIKADFAEKFKMSVDEYIDKIVTFGKYDRAFYLLSENNNTQADYVLMGGAEISLANLSGAEKDDRAFCLFFVDDSDTSILIPMVISYTYKANFYKTSWVHDGFETGAKPFALNSMEEIREWWKNDLSKPSIGDVFLINYHSFEGIRMPEQVTELVPSTEAPFPEEVAQLLKLLGGDYLQRISGINSPLSAVGELGFELGDIGLFPNIVALTEHNPLDN